jgi:hypothetical protein
MPQHVALKEVPQQQTADNELNLEKVSHPNIVQYFAHFEKFGRERG